MVPKALAALMGQALYKVRSHVRKVVLPPCGFSEARVGYIAPHLFSGINESFDPLDLSFPLHKGARFYLERNEPTAEKTA